MVHVEPVAELMDHDVILDPGRRHHQPPVEIEIAVRRAAAPPCFLGTDEDPVVGNDYFAFDWRSLLLEHIYDIAALRFTGEEFTLVPFGQAKLPTLDPDANWLRQI